LVITFLTRTPKVALTPVVSSIKAELFQREGDDSAFDLRCSEVYLVS